MSGSNAFGDLDVTRVEGPHSPERTAAAGRLIADAVRYLNYASMPADGAPGISYPGDVDAVLGAIAAAAGGLQQTFDQLAECLRADLATGRLGWTPGKPYADDPAKAVEEACSELEIAVSDCGSLRSTLARARRVTSAMHLAAEDESDDG